MIHNKTHYVIKGTSMEALGSVTC